MPRRRAEIALPEVEPKTIKWSNPLPPECLPRGLSRVMAAAYIGISPSLFDETVEDGRMPKPRVINRRRLWDRNEIDSAFDELPYDGDNVLDAPDEPIEFAV